ncbi:endo-alpha-N-acetylgalactosaminidase family protein [Clostridium sp.]|uniref:endo-alpha-N-acetylgalactosaminidase family protein n=1 Tax=Clostridium sp. TaxID=1506 RepID=UPI003F38DE5E
MNPRKKTMNKKLVALVASVVLLTQVASTMPVFANGDGLNNVGSTKTIAENVQPISDEVYTVLFDGTEKTDWKTLKGSGTHEVENGWLKVSRNTAGGNEFVFFDQNAPQIKDGEAEMVFKVDGDDSAGAGRFGFVLRPQTDGAHLFVGYDLNGTWKIGNTTFSGPSIVKGQEYKLQVRFVGKQIDVLLDGEQIHSMTVTEDIPVNSSYGIGFKTWYGKNDSYVDHFKIGPVGTVIVNDKEIDAVEEVNVETYVRLKPSLPNKVKVTYADGTTGTEEVVWDFIAKEDYAKEGSFQATGTILRAGTKVVANVTVKPDPEDGTLIPPETVVEEKKLQSEDMAVVLDNNFPRVIRYEWSDGEILSGEEEQLYIVELNGESYIPEVAFEQVDDKTANYTMTFKDLDLVMKLKMSLVENNVLKMEVTEINEGESYKVRSINFPGHSLASVKSTNNAQIAGVLTTGDWNNIREEFKSVEEAKVGSYNKTYGIINDDKFAIAINNNVIEGGNRAIIDIANKSGYKQASIANGTWTYRESLNAASAPKLTGTVAGVATTGVNQAIKSNETDIKKFLNKEYEAVYCGLGGVEDFEGKDLTGKVAIVDRGTHTFVDKAKNAQAAGASFVICINNADGAVPEQGNQDTINMIGVGQEYGEAIKAGLANGETTVKFTMVDDGVVPGGPEELPWSQIMVARDTNKSGNVNWQDAAILYRENMNEVQGGDYVRNSFSYIPFNIGSLTQAPFLRTGDMVKKLSNYTDGFGQLVLEKGYQGEGHDDVIADIGGHTGIRQGGKDDLNKLIEIGKDYNAKIGVHVNATEYHLDAFELDVDNLQPGFRKGWGWKDESYYVDQKKDVTSGELARRFGMLKEDHPDLGWIYVDVYTGNGWNANELAEIVNGNDWMLATEFNGPLEQQTAWTHWGGDPAYPNRGNESKIIRFIRNQEQDVFMSDDLLKGAKHTLSGGWGTRHDVEGFYAIETFYNQTLPSKYMQHFEIQEWEDDGTTGFVKFNDGLETRRENGVINMYQDGRLIASTEHETIDERGIGKTKLFIPWKWEQLNEAPENKVYHWNPYGGETTWDIPVDWAGTETIKLYELSDLGKTFVEEIPVVDGKVTIDAKKNTPYVVFQEKVNENRIDSWGEGSLIKDPGFDSQTLDSWKVETTADNMDHINIVNENVDRRKGNDALVIQGEVKPDLTLIPQSQMTATASNSQPGEEASMAIDGSASTLWHTSWSGVALPQSITLDLGGSYTIDKVTCLPRQSGDNGKILKYQLEVSTDGENFTKVSEGTWDRDSELKTINFAKTEATHVRLIGTEAVGAYLSMAEMNVHKFDENGDAGEASKGQDAKISQEIEGLVPGKTYTASVWVKSDGDRDVTLGVDCGGKLTTSTITRATKRTNVGEGLKWHSEKATRMRVEFTVPEGVTTANIVVDVPKSEKDTMVLIDDFRIWTNPLGTEKTNRDGYVLFEDFENVDEGHGPLYMGQNLGTDNRTHYAEKNPAGGQYMNWVINGRFSLKTNQQQGTTGEMLLTDESTLQLKPNTTYELGFKYTNKIDNLYSVAIKSKTAGQLLKETLKPGTVVGRPEDGPAYSREVKEYKVEFTTGNANDYYLAFEKGNGFDELILDDLYIKDLTPQDIVVSKPSNLKASNVTSNSATLTWNEPSETVGLEGYTIYKDGKIVAEVNDATSYTAEGLKSNSIYGFKVVAKYSNGEVSKPVSVNVRTTK